LDSTLEAWWTEVRARVHNKDKRRFDTLFVLSSWMLWKQRNARVFGNISKQYNTMQTTERIKEEFAMWEGTLIGLSRLRR
jgi:hypothetical protein